MEKKDRKNEKDKFRSVSDDRVADGPHARPNKEKADISPENLPCPLDSRSRVRTFSFIALEEPVSGFAAPKNGCISDDLAHFLTSHQYVYCSTNGEGKEIEPSFYIYNISLKSIMAIGDRYNQKRFLFVTFNDESKQYTFDLYLKMCGRKYCKASEETRIISAPSEEIEMFATVGEKFKIDFPFEPFKAGLMRLNKLINDRSMQYDEYKENYKEWILESVSENTTTKSQRLKRAILYGKNYNLFF
jgi:hypothetical protein